MSFLPFEGKLYFKRKKVVDSDTDLIWCTTELKWSDGSVPNKTNIAKLSRTSLLILYQSFVKEK